MEAWGVYFAVGILSVFGFGILLFLVCCNAHLDEIRMDWESRRERNHDRMRARDKGLKKISRFANCVKARRSTATKPLNRGVKLSLIYLRRNGSVGDLFKIGFNGGLL